VQRYQVQTRQAGGEWEPATPHSTASRWIQFTVRDRGTPREVRVRAVNIDGESAWVEA